MSLVQASLARGILVANGTPSRTLRTSGADRNVFCRGSSAGRATLMIVAQLCSRISFRQSSISQRTVEFRGSGVCPPMSERNFVTLHRLHGLGDVLCNGSLPGESNVRRHLGIAQRREQARWAYNGAVFESQEGNPG